MLAKWWFSLICGRLNSFFSAFHFHYPACDVLSPARVNSFCLRCLNTKETPPSSYFTDESYLSSLSSEDSKPKWLEFSPSLWTCTWEQGALFALHSTSDFLVPYFTVFFCFALLFSGPDSLQVRQTSPWVLASSIISSLAFIFTPILKQGPLSYVSPWSPVAHVPEEWLECLLPLFLTPFFIVKFVCSWNLHTCSRKHCRQFNNPNHQNKFSFMEIRQYLLTMATLLLSGTFPTLCWGEKEHELGCEMEDSPSSSSLMNGNCCDLGWIVF